MDYIFLNTLKVDKPYLKASRYIIGELDKLDKFQLEYIEKHKASNLELKENLLRLYLQKLENRLDVPRAILGLILFISFIQLSVCVYFAFTWGGLNSHQANVITISFLLVIISSLLLAIEFKRFKENINEALRLFLIIRHHNSQKIIDERNKKIDFKVAYKKGSPMDILFGGDE